MKIYNSLLHKVFNYRKTNHKKGLTIITGGNLDISKRLISKLNKAENPEILVLYKNYDNLKDEFYSNFDPKKQIQVFNCDLSNQEDKEEFISFLENNKKKVKNS